MKITCQSCQSKYTVSDEKVQGKTVKIKCRKCGATILVNSGGVTTSAPTDPVSLSTGGAADGGASYLLNVAEGDQRSMTLPEIVAAYQSSVITADTYVWADGMGDWQPLGQVDAIVAALNSPSAPAPAPYAAPAAEPAYPAAAAEPEHRSAARRDPGRGARDLFGNQEPAAPSAPAYNGSAQAAAPRAMPAAPPGGQRGGEENSMLFSLSALTAKPATSSAPKATTARDREDSGIIDLKALAAAAAVQSAAPHAPEHAAFLPDGGLFPLGAPLAPSGSANAAPPVVSPSMPPPKSKTPIFLGFGGVVAVAAIVGAFVFMRGGGPPPSPTPATTDTSATAATTAAAAPSTAVSAEPSALASASASADPSASPSAVAKAGKGGKGGPGKGGAPAGKGGAAAPAAPAAAAPAAAAPAPKKSSCGCAAGDLMCAMKCSAK